MAKAYKTLMDFAIELKDCEKALGAIVSHLEKIAENTHRPTAMTAVRMFSERAEMTLRKLKKSLEARMKEVGLE